MKHTHWIVFYLYFFYYRACFGGQSFEYTGDLSVGDLWTAPTLNYQSGTYWDFKCKNDNHKNTMYQKFSISFIDPNPVVKITSLFEFPDDLMILIFNSTSSSWKPDKCHNFVYGVYKLPDFEIPHVRVGVRLSPGNFTFVVSGKNSASKGRFAIQVLESDYQTTNLDSARTWTLQNRTETCSNGSAQYGAKIWTFFETQAASFEAIFLDTSKAVSVWQTYAIGQVPTQGMITGCVQGIQTEAYSPVPNYGYQLAYNIYVDPQDLTLFTSGSDLTQTGPYAGWIREPDDVAPNMGPWNGPLVPNTSVTYSCTLSSSVTSWIELNFTAENSTYFFTAGAPYNTGLGLGHSDTYLALYNSTAPIALSGNACEDFMVASDAGNGALLIVENLIIGHEYTLIVYSNNTGFRPVYRMTGKSLLHGSVEKDKEGANIGAIVGGVLGAFFGFGLLAAAVFVLLRRRRNTKKTVQRNRSKSIGLSSKEVTKVTNIEIQEKLGQGNFGEVYKGLWNGTTVVALKKLHEDDQMKDFHQEARMLETLKHPNILSYIGIYTKDSDQYIVTEFMSKGSLDRLLLVERSELTILEMVKMALQAAAGMVYLEQQRIIHRDLSLRNLLVSPSGDIDKYRIKIADFGLSRETQQGNYYTGNTSISFPVKWTAPEILLYPYTRFTSKCDVWSFGVMLWELFSYGASPYLGMSNAEAAEKVTEGYRLPKPKVCPDEVYKLMLKCWDAQPDARPTFKEIFEELLKVKKELSDEEPENLNNNNNNNQTTDNKISQSFYKDLSLLKKPLPDKPLPSTPNSNETSFYKEL